MMRTLLVTGGAGFIGGNYVLRSLSQDDAPAYRKPGFVDLRR